MDIYVVRHGETWWNREERLQGWLDSPLTEKGRRDADALGEKLKDVPFTAAYSSDQGRAVETARRILRDRNLPLVTTEDLRELALGPWEGRIFSEVEREDPERFRRYFDAPGEHGFPGVENFHDLMKRVQGFLESLDEKDGDQVLVVSHGVTIQGMLCLLRGEPLEEFWKDPMVDGASLTRLKKIRGKTYILEIGGYVKGKSY